MPEENRTFHDIMKDRYKKCLLDPIYFMKNFVKIQHPVRGTLSFNLYPFQEKTLEQFIENDFNIILKSRQMGITTLVAAYSLWLMLFNKDKNILVISIKQDVAKEIITKVRFANDHLPRWLRVDCVEDNRLSLKFKNGSAIQATSSTTSSGRSQALSLLILDEAAFIDGAEEIWASAQPTLSTGGKSIVLSTPNGVGNFFHKMWVESEEGRNKFIPLKLPWNLHPERDQNWRNEQDKIGENLRKTSQELDCDFLSSGMNVVDLAIIQWYKESKVRDPVAVTGIDNGFWRWIYPDYTRSYIVTADVARGDGEDFSAAHVLDSVTLDQCAEYKGQIGTKDFANFLVTVATEYNDALLIVERESHGWAALQQIIDRKYKNTFYSSADLKYVEVERQLTNRINREEKKLIPGFSTTMKTRPLVISNLEQYFREKTVNIFSKRTIAELEVFIWENGKAQAARGYNDDLIMSLGIGLWVRDTALRLRQEGIDLIKASIGNINVNKLPDIPIHVTKNSQYGQQSWKLKVRNNEEEDMRWLL